jgi:hypothetical protein
VTGKVRGMASSRTRSRSRQEPIGNAHPTSRRRSRRRLKTAIGWFLISAGLAIIAGLVIGLVI